MSQPTSTPSNSRHRLRLWRPAAWAAAGAALLLALLGAAGLTVMEAGLFPVTAVTPHGPFMGWATHTAMIHAVQRRARSVTSPSEFAPVQVRDGFRLYHQNCALCHGGPGVARAGWTAGLTPTPPYLLDAARRWSPAQLRVIVGDGVKMTAMPAWRTTLSERDTWSVVAFLEALPYLSAEDYRRLAATDGSGAAARKPVDVAHGVKPRSDKSKPIPLGAD